MVELATRHPDLFARAVAMEHGAAANNTTTKGLGRKWSFEEVGEAGRRALPLFDEGGDDCMCVGEATYED